MAHQFYPLTVKEIEQNTAECSLVTFDVKDEWKEQFQYIQGQHLTLKAEINGEEVRRSYSLCACPLDNEWRVAIKQIEGGLFSTYANQKLKKGDTVDVMPPNGRFYVDIEKDRQKNYVAFAAGSGITPVFSIIKTHLAAEPDSTFTLFYVNQMVSTIILREEIEALKNRFIDRFEVYHFLTRQERDIPLFNGRISPEKLDIIFKSILDKDHINEYFICGPEDMIFMIRDYLTDKEIDKRHIHYELFNASGQETKKKRKTSATSNGEMSDVTILEGGKSLKFQLAREGDSILDAALKRSADLPFACKGGVCCTCRAKLLEGEVDMDVNYSLEQDELDAGYILTCQSHPVSEKVVVDYDG